MRIFCPTVYSLTDTLPEATADDLAAVRQRRELDGTYETL